MAIRAPGVKHHRRVLEPRHRGARRAARLQVQKAGQSRRVRSARARSPLPKPPRPRSHPVPSQELRHPLRRHRQGKRLRQGRLENRKERSPPLPLSSRSLNPRPSTFRSIPRSIRRAIRFPGRFPGCRRPLRWATLFLPHLVPRRGPLRFRPGLRPSRRLLRRRIHRCSRPKPWERCPRPSSSRSRRP